MTRFTAGLASGRRGAVMVFIGERRGWELEVSTPGLAGNGGRRGWGAGGTEFTELSWTWEDYFILQPL